MANEGTKPRSASELEGVAGAGDIEAVIAHISGSQTREPFVAALMVVCTELRMIRVALAERNALLFESNEGFRHDRERAEKVKELSPALGVYVEALRAEREGDAPNPDDLDRTEAADHAAREVANTLLDLMRIEAGR
jgi:hypothetical protein